VSLPFKIEYNENLNLRDLGVTKLFERHLYRGLYERSGFRSTRGQVKGAGNNEQWGIYDQLITIDENSKHHGGFRNEFIEDVFFGEYKMIHKFADVSFKDMRWLVQDILKHGNLKPIPIQVVSKKILDSKNIKITSNNEMWCNIEDETWWYSDDDENLFKIHPGGNAAPACYFLGTTVQALIFSLKEDEFDFGGDILSYDNIKDIFIEGKEYKKFKSGIYFKTGYETFNHLLKTHNKVGLPKSEKLLCDGFWLFKSKIHDIAGYGAIFRNSFPFNLYIGAESKKEFDECCNKVIKIRDEIFEQSDTFAYFNDFFYDEKLFVSGSIDYMSDLYANNNFTSDEKNHVTAILCQSTSNLPCETKSAKINFIQIPQSDYMNVPKYNNYKGFSAYLNSKMVWERDIFDLFYLGNSKIAKSYLGNDLIFYNCEYPIWKYDIECYEVDTIKIPSEFCKSIVGD
jgi:hypothetical protein